MRRGSLGQPVEPAGQVPVPVAEQFHRCRQQDGADDGGVDEDGGGEAKAGFLHLEDGKADEDRKHADHDHCKPAGPPGPDGFFVSETLGA